MFPIIPFNNSLYREMKDSYLKISAKELIELANNSLDRTQKDSDNAKYRLAKSIIDDLTNKQNQARKSFWSKVFRYKEKPLPTINETIFSMEGSTEMLFLEMRFSERFEVAYKLLNAAKLSNEIFVSTSDLKILSQ